MKQYIYITILVAVSLSSCVSQKKCLQKFPPAIHDSIKLVEKIYYRDTSILVPGDQVYITDTLPCPGLTYAKVSTSKSGRTKAVVKINSGHMEVNCNIDPYLVTIDSLQEKITTLEKSYTQSINIPGLDVIKYKVPKSIWVYLIITSLSTVWQFRAKIFPLIISLFKKLI